MPRQAGLIVDCALGLMALDYGLSRHQWNVPIPHMFEFLKVKTPSSPPTRRTPVQALMRYAQLLWSMEIIFGPIIFFTEMSILLLYQKIFVVNRKSTTFILIQLVLWANLLFYTAMTLAVIFACSPIKKFWYPTIPGKCTSSAATILASAIFNVISNAVTVVLPVNAIWQLQMPTRRKIGVSAVFMAGLL